MKLEQALKIYSNRCVIIGHFIFMPGDEFPQGFVSARVLRDPRERTLSDYHYQLHDVPEYNLSPEGCRISHGSKELRTFWTSF
jgi:hypothetical protein